MSVTRDGMQAAVRAQFALDGAAAALKRAGGILDATGDAGFVSAKF